MEIRNWITKYKPEEVEGMILNPAVRNKLENILMNPQNIILHGYTGVGKGTFADIYVKKTGSFDLRINASQETGIDMIRDKVISFAQAPNPTSFFDIKNTDGEIIEGNHKYLKMVILNETENLSLQAQAALREPIENVETRCKFIFMTNNLSKIDEAIVSRCPPVEIVNPPIGDIIRHVENILDAENISYDGESVSNIVLGCYPDIRRTIKEVQNSCDGQTLISSDSYESNEAVDKLIMDLRLHMAYYNKEKKEIYNMIKDKPGFDISERQFYYLLSGKDQNKIRTTKKMAVLSCIQEQINLRGWLNDYLKL
jgi:DNA polymerase III delta prime subunit